MTEEKRPLKVFLCHARSDKDAVKALYARLTKDGVDAWLDEEKLLPGQAWRDVIEESVRTSDIVLVCLSSQSVTKEGFVQKEIKIALDVADEKPEDTIFVIPARLDECVIPRRLKDLQWVDLYEEGGYPKLLKGLKLRDEQLEKARIKKEEIIKRRLPYFETPATRGSVTQKNNENSTDIAKKSSEGLPLRGSSVRSEFHETVEQLSHKNPKRKKLIKTEYIIAIIGAAATIIAGILGSPLIENLLTPISTVMPTSTNTEITPVVLATPSTQLLYVYDLILPSGHVPPDAQGNTRPNDTEIPEADRETFSLQMASLQLPLPSPNLAIRIQIPVLGVDAPIVQGDGWEQLKMGVGQHIGSVNPGEYGNVVLAAHNDIYGELFRNLDQLKKGDEVILYTEVSSYKYLITSVQVVDPTLVDVMLSTRKRTLTLITSYPYLVDNMRFVVRAELQSNVPLPNPTSMRIGVVSGHWGNDSGTVCTNGITEVGVNAKIAAIIQQKLLSSGFDVDLMKEFDPRLINYKGAALVSIHNDSCDYINDQATGFKVTSSINNNEGETRLASCLVDRYERITNLAFHPGSITFDMSQYHTFNEVDKGTPIVIIETGYLNLDYKILTEQTDLVAQGIVDGILCFVNNEKIAP